MASYSSLANLLALIAQTVVSVATVRLTLPYLGEERFGVWMTVVGIAGLLTFADFGIGNALISRVAAARAGAAGVEPHVAVTGGLACLFVIGLSVGAVVAGISAVMPWSLFVRGGLSPLLEVEFRQSAILFGSLFGAFLFTSGLRKVYEGLQRGYVAHGMMAVCSCISLALLCISADRQSGIPLLIMTTFGVNAILPSLLVAPLTSTGYFRPRVAAAAGCHEWRQLIRAGSLYSVVQVGSLLLQGSEPMLIAGLQGSSVLAGFAVVQRLFQIVVTPARILVTPYWGAYADAYARGDHDSIWRMLRHQTLLTALLTTTLAATLTATSGWVMRIWTKDAIPADPALIAACCCLCVLDGVMLPFGMYLNGIGCIRPQAAATIFALFTYFPAKIAALAYGGLTWMIYTTIAFQLANCLLFYGIFYRKQVWPATHGE